MLFLRLLILDKASSLSCYATKSIIFQSQAIPLRKFNPLQKRSRNLKKELNLEGQLKRIESEDILKEYYEENL